MTTMMLPVVADGGTRGGTLQEQQQQQLKRHCRQRRWGWNYNCLGFGSARANNISALFFLRRTGELKLRQPASQPGV